MARLKLTDSVYQQKGANPVGLSVSGGMLINNRPCSTTGIKQMADLKKEMKRQDKISMISEAILRAEDMKTFRF
jgi:hypothetical protein